MITVTLNAALAGTLLILAGSIVSCTGSGAEVPKTVEASSPAQTSPHPIPLTSDTRQKDQTTFSGALMVEHQLDVAALRDGVISNISADVGTMVHKGQTLARLDDRQITSDREAARARVQELESDLKNWDAEVKVLEADQTRAEKMWDAQLITKEQLDHIRYNLVADRYQDESALHKLDNARATLQSLQFEMEKTRIRSPFDGVVARRYVREGQRVDDGDRLFWVTSVAPLLVRFTVPDHLSGIVKKGDEVRVSSSAEGSLSHPARIRSISPVVDPSSSTVEVVGLILGSPGDLRPGMTVNISLRQGK